MILCGKYYQKFSLLSLKVRSNDAIFDRLAQVNRLKSIVMMVTQYDLTIDFQFLKHIKYYCCTEKSHCDATILTTKSIKNRTHFRFSTDFAFDFRLRWSHGTMRKSDGKSDTKSNESCDRTCTCLAWKRLIQ